MLPEMTANEKQNGRERAAVGRARRGLARDIARGLYHVRAYAEGERVLVNGRGELLAKITWSGGTATATSPISTNMAAGFQNYVAQCLKDWPRSCDAQKAA